MKLRKWNTVNRLVALLINIRNNFRVAFQKLVAFVFTGKCSQTIAIFVEVSNRLELSWMIGKPEKLSQMSLIFVEMCVDSLRLALFFWSEIWMKWLHFNLLHRSSILA